MVRRQDLPQLAKHFYRQSLEERNHAMMMRDGDQGGLGGSGRRHTGQAGRGHDAGTPEAAGGSL
jgi:hypothetical protein